MGTSWPHGVAALAALALCLCLAGGRRGGGGLGCCLAGRGADAECWKESWVLLLRWPCPARLLVRRGRCGDVVACEREVLQKARELWLWSQGGWGVWRGRRRVGWSPPEGLCHLWDNWMGSAMQRVQGD